VDEISILWTRQNHSLLSACHISCGATEWGSQATSFVFLTIHSFDYILKFSLLHVHVHIQHLHRILLLIVKKRLQYQYFTSLCSASLPCEKLTGNNLEIWQNQLASANKEQPLSPTSGIDKIKGTCYTTSPPSKDQWEVGVAQWGECLPVSRVRFLDPASYVGWVCSWFSPLPWGFLSGFSGFPPLSKINISKFQFHWEFEGLKFISQRLLILNSQPIVCQGSVFHQWFSNRSAMFLCYSC